MLRHLGSRHRRREIQLHRTLPFPGTEHTKILSLDLQENVRSPLSALIFRTIEGNSFHHTSLAWRKEPSQPAPKGNTPGPQQIKYSHRDVSRCL